MISEQTATHALTRPFAETGAVIAVTDPRSTGWQARLQVVVAHTKALTITVLGALGSYGNPSLFEFERRGPTHQRLGAGLSRESDSFWPLSDW
jgi:hypothetical protein